MLTIYDSGTKERKEIVSFALSLNLQPSYGKKVIRSLALTLSDQDFAMF